MVKRNKALHLYLLTRFSNHNLYIVLSNDCFTPLFTYKVLKPRRPPSPRRSCFTPLFTYKVLKPQIFFQGHHRTHNILAYVQAFSLYQYQCKTFSKLVMLICNNAIVIVKNIQFFTISFVICTEFYQHQLYFTICGHFVQLSYLLIC